MDERNRKEASHREKFNQLKRVAQEYRIKCDEQAVTIAALERQLSEAGVKVTFLLRLFLAQ